MHSPQATCCHKREFNRNKTCHLQVMVVSVYMRLVKVRRHRIHVQAPLRHRQNQQRKVVLACQNSTHCTQYALRLDTYCTKRPCHYRLMWSNWCDTCLLISEILIVRLYGCLGESIKFQSGWKKTWPVTPNASTMFRFLQRAQHPSTGVFSSSWPYPFEL